MTTLTPPLDQRATRASLLQGWPARAALAAGVVLAVGVLAVGPARLIAQIEGDRGIAPVVVTNDIEVNGVEVEATGKTAAEARANGWKMAYKQAWAMSHGPAMDDGSIEAMVSSVVIEREQIGPHHYWARLGVVFDRGRASAFASGANGMLVRRSAPMLVLPVLYSGGVGQVYEVRGAWQKVWAEFRSGASLIDYVRPSGAGGDSLLLNAGQTGRRSRVWWRGLLDQYGASDVLIPVARLERQWPGGPVKATFTARFGPDNTYLDSFTMTAQDDGDVPEMLGQALARLDRIYSDALQQGRLTADPTLSLDHPEIDPGLAQVIAAGHAADAAAAARAAAQAAAARALPGDAAGNGEADAGAVAPVAVPMLEAKPVALEGKASERATSAFSVQFPSPDAAAVDAALSAVRGASGVQSAGTVSIAIGGTSVMRVAYVGSAKELAEVLKARGWSVKVSGSVLKIKR